MATSPGARGGITILELAVKALPRFGGNVVAHLSVPNFYDNFDAERNTLKAGDLNNALKAALNTLCQSAS